MICFRYSRTEALIHICQFQFPNDFTFGPKFVNESIYEVIKDIAPNLNDTLIECMWQYEYRHCSEFFAPVLTEVGACFTFNALNTHEIYTDQ